MPSVPAGKTPDPKYTAKQKEEHARALEQQLQEGADKLGRTMKTQVDDLHSQAAQEKTLHSLLVDQQVKQQELLLSQQYNQQLMLLTQAAQRQGAELEQQATNLMLDYQQRKVEEDFVASQAGVERQFADMQSKFQSELAKSSVYPAPPIQPPRLGAGMTPGFNLSPSQAPPLLPSMGQGAPAMLQYRPPALPSLFGGPAPALPSAGIRAPSVGPRPQLGSFSAAGGSARAPAAAQLSFVPQQLMLATPTMRGRAGPGFASPTTRR